MDRRCVLLPPLVLFVFMLIAAPLDAARSKSASNTSKRAKLKYPETRRVDQVDEFFGVKVPDPYRWLEADIHASSEVAEWAKKQNEITRKYLDAIPQRAAIEKRLTELQNFERYSCPYQKGGKYF